MTEETQNFEEIDEEIEEIDDETDPEILTFSLSIDAEDFSGTMLDDAIEDKMHPPNTEWPNDIYREFMEIVMEYQLSNSCGDRIIKLINNSRNSDEKSLPINTKEGRKFLDANEFPYMKFKKVPITKFQDTDYNFYYQPIIHGVKVLLPNLILIKNSSLNIKMKMMIYRWVSFMGNNIKANGGMSQKKTFLSIIDYYR